MDTPERFGSPYSSEGSEPAEVALPSQEELALPPMRRHCRGLQIGSTPGSAPSPAPGCLTCSGAQVGRSPSQTHEPRLPDTKELRTMSPERWDQRSPQTALADRLDKASRPLVGEENPAGAQTLDGFHQDEKLWLYNSYC